MTESLEDFRSRRRLRMRRHRRRAYIRSVHVLPSLATLGNAVCGFAAMYIVTMSPDHSGTDPWTILLTEHRFLTASYLILLAMVFDALDGRLARWARHTTDFGGQLDSMADVISFGAAPAMIALVLFKDHVHNSPWIITRMVWAMGAIYMACAAIRLARFNTANEHGEQHHMSFLGLPSPGAAAAVIGLVLIQQDLAISQLDSASRFASALNHTAIFMLPILVLGSGLLMVSKFRYPHLVNQQLRGRKPAGRLVMFLVLLCLLGIAHRYTIGVGAILYALSAPAWWLWLRSRSARGVTVAPAP